MAKKTKAAMALDIVHTDARKKIIRANLKELDKATSDLEAERKTLLTLLNGPSKSKTPKKKSNGVQRAVGVGRLHKGPQGAG